MSEEKQYYAFISYNHADKKEARDLQHWLEYYKLPTNLRKDNPFLPQYVRPVFRDSTNLEIGELSAQIKKALEQSMFLIVICSPNSAQSKWVNDEVEYFISLGKQDKIIPYIIEGVPHADDPLEECYPPALLQLSREKELLGANVNEVGKEAAGIRVVAKMFGIRYDMLYQRYKRDQRKKNAAILSSAITFILLLLSFLGYVIYSNHELQAKNELINQQNNNLIQSRDSTRQALETLQMKNDTINQARNELKYSYNRLQQTNKELEQSNTNLEYTNEKLHENIILLQNEREKVRQENWKMLENHSRVVAAKADEVLRKEEDYYTATLMALEVLPAKLNNPNRPWTVEADRVLRKGTMYNNDRLPINTFFVYSVDFSPDSKRVVVGKEGDAQVWDIETGKLVFDLPIKGRGSYSVAYNPQGNEIAVASADGVIYIFNAETGQCARLLRGHTRVVSDVSYSNNGTMIASASYDRTVRVWDAKTGDTIYTLDGHPDDVTCAIFSPNGKNILSISLGELYLWDLGASKHKRINVHKWGVNSVSYSPDGRQIIAAVRDTTICICNSHNGKIIKTLHGHTDQIQSVAYSPDGKRIVSASLDGTVRVWDAETGENINIFHENESYLMDAKLSPSGQILASSGWNGIVRIWYLNKKREDFMVQKQDWDYMKEKTYTPDHTQYFSYGYERSGNIDVWSTDGTSHIHTFKGHKETVNAVSLNRKGSRIASASKDSTIRIWNAETGDSICTLRGHRGAVNTAVFSHDGKHVVSASKDSTIRIWNAETGDSIFALRGHTAEVTTAAFSSDGERIVSASWDRTIRIWDVRTQKCIEIINVESVYTSIDNIIESIFFSNDNKYIIAKRTIVEHTGCPSPNDIRLFVLERRWYYPPIQNVIDEARERYKERYLQPEERRKYYLE